MAKKLNTKSSTAPAPVATIAPAPARAAAPAPVVAIAPVVTATATAPAPRARRGNVHPRQRITGRVTRALRVVERFGALAKQYGLTDVADLAALAKMRINEAQTAIGALAEGWEPAPGAAARGAARASSLAIGQTVELAERVTGKYKDMIAAEHMSALTVSQLSGKRVVVTTPDGLRTLVNAVDLRPKGFAAARAAREAAAPAAG
jgi:hypothetical protein